MELRKLESSLACNTANVSDIPFSVIPHRMDPSSTQFCCSMTRYIRSMLVLGTRLSSFVNMYSSSLCKLKLWQLFYIFFCARIKYIFRAFLSLESSFDCVDEIVKVQPSTTPELLKGNVFFAPVGFLSLIERFCG